MSSLQEASQRRFTRRKAIELGVLGIAGLAATAFAPAKPDQSPSPDLPYTVDSSKWKLATSYTSDFTGSEDYRVHNIIAGANGLNNHFWYFDQKLNRFGKNVIKPGATFSINSILEQVDDYVTGWAIGPDLEHVAVNGGGICQIPTTMFVASLNAGLAIEERTNHAYYNGWYFGDPNDSKEFGMDATVYIPGPDLVVRNTYDYPIRFFFKLVEGEHLKVDVVGPPELKPYTSEIDGPYFYDPIKKKQGKLVKNAGKYPWAASTIVTQNVWKDKPTDIKKPWFSKPFESHYQESPYG
ncbi:MAG TPA: VanW family protein [Patescibacteria group bacterium]|nr:VanW family protein [Patescibacteria group bacterium]